MKTKNFFILGEYNDLDSLKEYIIKKDALFYLTDNKYNSFTPAGFKTIDILIEYHGLNKNNIKLFNN